jgi:segregation and condensation protein A
MNLTASSLRIELPRFEGPMALLLYLIKKEEMDIMDIQIHRITQQYLEYIKLMREMDLELAGEFIAMAATLLQIKSQMLLPQYQDASAGEEEALKDPRRPLVQRLLEYQQMQEAASKLGERVWLGREVWARDFTPAWIQEVLAQNSPSSVGMEASSQESAKEVFGEDSEQLLFSLIRAYRLVMRAAEKRVHKVARKLKSIAQRIQEISSDLVVGTQVVLRKLIAWERIEQAEEKKFELLITFLSVLEMAKMGFVRLFQTQTYGDIYIEALKDPKGINLSQVDEFDSAPNLGSPMPPLNKVTVSELEEIDSLAESATPSAQKPSEPSATILVAAKTEESAAEEEETSETDMDIERAWQEMGFDETLNPEPRATDEELPL